MMPIRKKVTNLDTSTVLSDYKFLSDQWNLVAILTSSGSSFVSSFMWGLDLSGSLHGAGGVGGLLSVINVSNGIHFCAYDGNGNVQALAKGADGNVTANYEYGPFGEALRITGSMAKVNPFRFSTKFQDDESDFLYYGYRSYNPSIGRWLARDPIGEHGGQNPYSFVANAPLQNFDFVGLVGMGEVRFRERNCGCKCGEVKLTYLPGGSNFEIGFYESTDPQGNSLGLRFGNGITIEWSITDGDPKLCKYYQYEKGRAYTTINGTPINSPPAAERDIEVHPTKYTSSTATYIDSLGNPALIVGDYFKVLKLEITFKCVDSDKRIN